MSYARMAEIAHKVTLLAVALLLLTLALATLWMPRGSRVPYPLLFLIVIALPLLILIPGLWRGGMSSCVWLGFVSMLYFAQAVVALLSSQARLLDILQLVFSIALFTGALLFVRWRARAIRGAETQ